MMMEGTVVLLCMSFGGIFLFPVIYTGSSGLSDYLL